MLSPEVGDAAPGETWPLCLIGHCHQLSITIHNIKPPITSLLEHVGEYHKKRVRSKFPNRNVRSLDFYGAVIPQAFSNDSEQTVFNSSFFDVIRERMFEDNAKTKKWVLVFFICAFASFVNLAAPEAATVILPGVRIQNLGALLDLSFLFGGVSIYAAINYWGASTSNSILLMRYTDFAVGKVSYYYQDRLKNLMLAKYGSNFGDWVAEQIVVKGKHIWSSYKLKNILEILEEYLLIIAAISLILLWGVSSYKLLINPPISTYISVASVSLFWVFCILACLKIVLMVSVLTGQIAKGKRPAAPEEGNA